MKESKIVHCCGAMEQFAGKGSREELIEYNAFSREYHFLLNGPSLGMHTEFFYCPWCGKKLPESLFEEWSKVIKENYGWDRVHAEEWERLPEKFRTEEWWREKGL